MRPSEVGVRCISTLELLRRELVFGWFWGELLSPWLGVVAGLATWLKSRQEVEERRQKPVAYRWRAIETEAWHPALASRSLGCLR
ncbi:MAG: hypothetical protein ACRBN8_45005 [Nannocystales bacterium]